MHQPLTVEQQLLPLLADLLDAAAGGGHTDQAHVHQPGHAPRHIAVAVDQLVQHIGGVLGGLDGGDALVRLDASRGVRDEALRDVGVHRDVHKAVALVRGHRLALGGGDGLIQQLHIQVVADGLHVAVLALTQQVARAADLQIPHGDAEARAKAGELPNGGQPLVGQLAEGLVPAEGEVGVGLAA